MRFQFALLASALLAFGCTRNPASKPPSPTAYGTQIVEVSGGKQMAEVGSALPQQVVVQVNGADGNPVSGAPVSFGGNGLQGGGAVSVNLRETALGYEATLGKAVNDQYCVRCHDPESTPERVSNFDNLSPAPHQFSDGGVYNRLSDTDLINMITYGGPAAGKSPQMPAYGATVKPAEIKALLAYIRSIADPPYQTTGVKYGK